nr:metallophosphoesterase [uncultured Devosia sp.]
MKIALFADIHHGPHSHAKKEGWDALPELEKAVRHVQELGADMLLDLGDRISDTTIEHDKIVEAEVRDRLAQFNGPRYHVIGNHDVGNLTPADNAEIFGEHIAQQVVDLGEARLILWQANTKGEFTRDHIGFPHVAGDLAWLIDTLNADDRPAIIATHIPLSGHSQIGNFYFENNADVSTYPDHAEVRRAVEATGKVAVWLSGHVHWNTVTNVHNIQHITIQSFSERFTTYPEPATAYAMLEVKDGSFTLEVFGLDPFFIKLPFRASGTQKWLPAMGKFGGDVEGQDAIQERLSAHVAENA